MMPVTLIVNPAAGNGRGRQCAAAATAGLTAAGLRPVVRESASLADARQLATTAAADGHTVVAVGGDGMASALAGVAAGAGCRYGIIPAGRGNDLARVLGIPSDPGRAALTLAAGHSRQIDLIAVRTPGQPEVLVTGSVYLGVPAMAGQIANASRLRGPAVYPIAALQAVARWTPAGFSVRGDEQHAEFAGFAVVVANSAYFGAGMRVAPPARVDDGELDVVIMRDAPKLVFLRALARIRDGSHTLLPQVQLSRATSVRITADRPVPAAADGESLPFADPLPAGQPLELQVRPGALTVIAPAAEPPTRPTRE